MPRGKIVAVLFTWSWGGFSVRYEDGRRESLSCGQLLEAVGADEYLRLSLLTAQLAGHWHPVPPKPEGGKAA